METELKLLIDPADADALRHHPLLEKYATEKPHEQTLSGIYFDTSNNELKRADAGLRVRQVDNDWVQTLKAGGNAIGGLHERQEWESKVEGPLPDLAALREMIDPKSSYAKLLKGLSKPNRLMPTFTTHVKRTVWELRLPEGDEVECVIDQGSIDYGTNKLAISELELELKSGEPKHLLDFALQLQRDFTMHIGNDSKADRGYDLIAPSKISAVKATPIQLSTKMSIEEAFQTILKNCLSHIQANEIGVTKEHDIESVHQMRVGLRRLRSALSMFKDIILCPKEIQTEVGWLGKELGAARDWDVLAESTLPKIGKEITEPAILNPVRKATQTKAAENHETAATAVLSSRYTKLILTFYRWVIGAEWRESMTDTQRGMISAPIIRFANKTLLRDQKNLVKRGSCLKGANPETRHRVRIAAKKTRYATEFFQSLYSERRVRPYVKALSRLQDELGALNDLAVATRLLQQLEIARPKIASCAGFVRGYLTCRTTSDDRELDQLWKQFNRMSLPCKK